MFEKVLKSVTNLRDWSYVGLVCFTEIENRGVFMSELEDLRQDEIKVSQDNTTINVYLHYIVDSDKRGAEGRKQVAG